MRAALILTVLAGLTLLAAPVARGADSFLPEVEYDRSIPTLEQVTGFDWGANITTHAECEAYLQALDRASDHARLFSHGASWEGRKLYYLVIGQPERLEALEPIKQGLRELAHPLSLSPARRAELLDSLPVVTWVAATIHGNESSGMDAALWLAWRLLAARGDSAVERIFESSLVVIDPLQNPDGHDRFAYHFRGNSGPWPSDDPAAAERDEGWPGGRTNHYLFDMNRDWFMQTQAESRGRVQAFLEWRPQVFLDLHEMGSDNTYYFPPTAPPVNRLLAPQQVEWYERFGRNNAAWFDRFGFRYTTREMFDAYYPGYGCTWPSLSGAIGMTFEQASSRGLVVRREDQTVLPYRETVRHHAVAAYATALLAAQERRKMLEDYLAVRTPPASIPSRRAYLIPPGADPACARKLAGLLLAQGIEVRAANAAFSAGKLSAAGAKPAVRQEFPAGTLLVPARQESYALAANLLEPQIAMDSAFIAEQERRLAAGLGDQVYDVTGWSLPLMVGAECWRTEELPAVESSRLEALPEPSPGPAGAPQLAWLLDGRSCAAIEATAELLRQGVRLYTSDQPFTMDGRKFARGSFIIPVNENGADLRDRLAAATRAHGAEFVPADHGWTSAGVTFGSPNVSFLPAPKVLLAWGEGTHGYGAGWARYLLERRYGIPVTAVAIAELGAVELARYNVLVLPNGWGYGERIDAGALERLKGWVRQGGTLVALQGATRWLTEPQIGLLEAAREFRLDEDSAGTAAEKQKDGRVPGTAIGSWEEYRKQLDRERREPLYLPGVLARLRLDPDHWLSAGFDSTLVAFAEGYEVYAPLTRGQGRNVAVFDAPGALLLSGHAWPGPSVRQLAFKPYLMYRPLGKGHVIAFSEDPSFRAFLEGAGRLLANAVLLGPGH